MRVLVTGGTGQVGGGVARALIARGDTVRALVRDPERLGNLEGVDCEHVVGDVTRPETLDAATDGVDAVVHAAGVVSYWHRKADFQRRVNVDGTRHVLDAAARAGVRRAVITSSIAALGSVPGDGLGDEDTPYNWGGMGLGYMDTKRAAQDLALSDGRLDVVAVLPGIVFGPGDVSDNGLRVLRMVATGAAPFSPPGSTTAATLNDVVQGHLAALDRGHSGRSYVLGGWTGPFLDLFRLAADVVGAHAPTRTAPPIGVKLLGLIRQTKARFTGTEPSMTWALGEVSCRNRKYRSDRARAELGYSPEPLRSGMEAALKWAKDKGRWPQLL